MELIDKSALVAEIKKLRKRARELYGCSQFDTAYDNVLESIDTLEVKEMDLDKEFDKYCENLYVIDIQEAPFTEMYDCAKHFFELGLKVKGEYNNERTDR